MTDTARQSDRQHPDGPGGESLRIAYMMSRFPKITETFILYEMLAVERAGASIEVFPLRREKTKKMHPEATDLVRRAHFVPLMSAEVVADNLRMLVTNPMLWFSTLWTIIRANLGCRRFLMGALAVFPKCVTTARRMRQAGVHHIHAHFASHPAAAAWMIHRFSGIPYSFVAHGSDLHRAQHMLREKVRDAGFVVAISEYNADMIRAAADSRDEAKVKVIHCGIQPDDFARPESFRNASTSFNVVCIGTLHEVKGQRYLIEAVHQLLNAASPAGLTTELRRRVRLRLVGDGPDEAQLRQQVRQLGLESVVVFEGRRDRHEIIEILNVADVLVAPSVPTADGRREGIPVVLMEGMASGLPVISSRLSGIPELVTDGVHGFLTDPGDVEAIRIGLQTLAEDASLRRRMGAAGRSAVQQHFSLSGGVRLVLQQIGRLQRSTGTADVRPAVPSLASVREASA
ncbi:MAG: glycosyltransferase family 4 protein [Fuerstiella sp.]